MIQMPGKLQVFKNIAECQIKLRYGLVKVNGKQIRRSLKTPDPVIAKRRQVEFRAKAGRLTVCAARVMRELRNESTRKIKNTPFPPARFLRVYPPHEWACRVGGWLCKKWKV